MFMRHARFVLITLVLLTSLHALADSSTPAGDYVIHHHALTTDTLDPAVARTNGILRSKFRGMLNVTVIKGQPGTGGRSVGARVEVNAGEPDQPAKRLPMREIRMGEDVYYIGEFPVKDLQVMAFTIEVTPEKTSETYRINLEQPFFID